MKSDRRYHLFNDYLRERFGERLQRVTLSGGLLCGHPLGREECPFCQRAVARDPGWGRGAPPHEQLRRGINFSRRRGEATPRLQVTIPAPPAGEGPPIDHVRATLEEVARDAHVAVVSLWAPVAAVDEELSTLLRSYAAPERDVWLEMDDLPGAWPIERREDLRLGVQVDLGLGPAPNGANGHSAELAADRVRLLKPDAVGFVAPAYLTGTEAGARYQAGDLDEPELEEFADRAAEFLERIPESITVHPLVLFSPNDAVLGPHWVLNRQKVEAAVAEALEARGTVQGEKA
jgi:radical SAM superfamily enzyme